MSRLDVQRDAEPQLMADVWLYESADGGRAGPALPGFGCVLMTNRELPYSGWDALLLLRDQPLHPGERRRLGFVFLTPESAVPIFSQAERFFLWDGRFIGEGLIIPGEPSQIESLG